MYLKYTQNLLNYILKIWKSKIEKVENWENPKTKSNLDEN